MNAAAEVPHPEHHKAHRGGWLRAAVLGANDGLVSISSLMVGVAAAEASNSAVVTAGVAAVAAGALSMAVGEWVSVSSQVDIERADEEMERFHLADDPAGELEELTSIYVGRGLDRTLAIQVAQQLTAHDALDAHLRDELGRNEHSDARPLQAALASAGSFLVGGVIPFIGLLVPVIPTVWAIMLVTFFGLAAAGSFSGFASGMAPWKPALRVVVGGVLAMGATYGVGALFGTTIA